MAFVFGLQTLWLKDISKIYQLKGLKPKNNDHTKFYECCDLTKKVYLILLQYIVGGEHEPWHTTSAIYYEVYGP